MKEEKNVYLFQDDNIKVVFTKRNIDAKNISFLKENLTKYNFTVENLSYSTQIHGVDVKVVDFVDDNLEEADGLVTNKDNIPLLIFTADCVPLVFYDSKKRVIALAHAGWRGTYKNISKNILAIMIDKYNCNISNINVIIGPHIKKKNYEVSKDLIDKFSVLNIPNYYEVCKNKFYLDLECINITMLERLGIKRNNIINTNFCTVEDNDKFYSYRQDNGTTSRIGTVIELI
ncbi:peptidoglycan editing factor PgeF [Gemella sp. GH3]|uniref:peptidoglycan editing factor PgeF n=1 Tax=unclassified Gemella TaxID=2624949 RepID=UPI0015CFEEED|nr:MULTISPECIES: peptidoglycan editing factor PgeF [unclassified Gemella]MBF0714191.1 peptidoglycan editing factor PgeF [Gemella sp. GH3.1]NYS51143.1 peptidoglycan editing factor PgeF [Gemella sp. GH3]